MCPLLCLLLTQASGELRLTNRRTIWIAVLDVFCEKKVCVRSKNCSDRLQPVHQIICSEMRISEEHPGVFVT